MKWNKPKRLIVVIGITVLLFTVYIWIVNLNTPDLTIKQKILKAVYPVFLSISRAAGGKRAVSRNSRGARPPVSIYSIRLAGISGQPLDLGAYAGKKILIVNTASDCGYTPQYEALEQVYRKYSDRLVVLGFPSNNFKNQEKGDNATIAEFCRVNFGVSFPLAAKSDVVPGRNQNPVFYWLTHPAENGWNSRPPEWNFSKFLVDETGRLMYYFGPSVSPLDDTVQKAIQE